MQLRPLLLFRMVRVNIVAFDLGEIVFEVVKLVKAVKCIEVACNWWSPALVRQRESHRCSERPEFEWTSTVVLP